MMKRNMAIVFGILLIFSALPLFAQAPPGPLQDDLYNWMIGNWEGTTESPMGKMNDEMEVDWDLEHQFIGIRYKSKTAETDPAKLEAMAKAMGMTKEQLQTPYKARGILTVNPQTKEYIGYWFGSFRDIMLGKGVRDGNKITMTWTDAAGTSVGTIEKADENKMMMTFTRMDPQGKVVAEGAAISTLMRKAKKEKSGKS